MLLHWVFKIGNLKKNIEFYNLLGMRVLRHEEFDTGCEAQCNGAYSRPWSKTMIGYGKETDNFVFELTYNYGISAYRRGNDFRYAIIGSDNPSSLLDVMSKAGYPIVDGEYVLSPDGYPFRIIRYTRNCALGVALNVSNLDHSVDYYVNVLQLHLASYSGVDNNKVAKVSFSSTTLETYLELYQQSSAASKVEHGDAYGRIAIAVDDASLKQREQEIVAKGERIHTPYVSLDTPGKATVQVVILLDRDGYEICLVGRKGYFELCRPFPGCDSIDFEGRAALGSREE